METITIDGVKLPAYLHYSQDDSFEFGEEREIAFYVDGRYMTRGWWSDLEDAIRSRRPLSVGEFIREGRTVQFVIDQSFSSFDIRDLCWCGPKISLDTMRKWIDQAKPVELEMVPLSEMIRV